MQNVAGGLRVTVSGGERPVVKLTGQADFHNRHRIERAFDRLLATGHTDIGTDLGGLEYLDSSAVSALVGCATKVVERGGAVELIDVTPRVSRVLNLCGAASFFESRTRQVPVSGMRDGLQPSENFWHVSDFSLPATPEAAAMARARVASVVRALPLGLADSEDVVAAVGEALANAIKHGCKCDRDLRVTVRCVAGPGRLAIDVTDPGDGFDPESVGKPPTASPAEGGMGIYMMRELMDEVTFAFTNSTVARLVKYIPRPDEAETG